MVSRPALGDGLKRCAAPSGISRGQLRLGKQLLPLLDIVDDRTPQFCQHSRLRTPHTSVKAQFARAGIKLKIVSGGMRHTSARTERCRQIHLVWGLVRGKTGVTVYPVGALLCSEPRKPCLPLRHRIYKTL